MKRRHRFVCFCVSFFGLLSLLFNYWLLTPGRLPLEGNLEPSQQADVADSKTVQRKEGQSKHSHRHLSNKVGDTRVRYDCHPDQQESESRMRRDCKVRQCRWSQSAPRCYFPDKFQMYRLKQKKASTTYAEVLLMKTDRRSGFQNDVKRIQVSVKGVSDDVAVVSIEEYVGPGNKSTRWKPPIPVLNLNGSLSQPKWSIRVKGGELSIVRVKTEQQIFQINMEKIIFADQFIQCIVRVPHAALYGFGGREGPHRKTAVNADRDHIIFFNRRNEYSSQPFYMMYEPRTNHAHGVLFMNSNPSDVTLTKVPSLVYRTIGGDMQFILFMGPDPVEVIRQKAIVIGQSPLPPYWSLGFQLSRERIDSLTQLKKFLISNIKMGIPVDAWTADLYFMNNYNMFTIGKEWHGLRSFVDKWHKSGRYFFPIVNLDLSANEPNDTDVAGIYERGLAAEIYVRDEKDHVAMIRNRNPVAVMPDFTHPNVSTWWQGELGRFYDKVPYDGIWLDVNEPTNHNHKKINSKNMKERKQPANECPVNKWNNPPYNPVHELRLEFRTLCMSDGHAIGPHYNVHNIYGLLESEQTFRALSNLFPKRRPFILSRSTFTGSGSYVSSWSGDVNSTWADMKSSITSILDYNLFGIPHMGADVCGFLKTASPELCARWHSLGAFYPFARNHNSHKYRSQDPGSRGGIVAKAARSALYIRYELLPHMYTKFYWNAVRGDPVVRSLKMNFPRDQEAEMVEHQYMWGEDLLITPVVDLGVRSVSAYFPAGVWYDYQNGSLVRRGRVGGRKSLHIPVTQISVIMRGGHVFPVKEGHNKTTVYHKNMPFSLFVALSQAGTATGHLYWDDGDGMHTIANKKFFLLRFQVRNNTLISDVLNSFNCRGSMDLKRVRISGVSKLEEAELIRGSQHTNCTTKFDLASKVGTILPPAGTGMRRPFMITWK